jgi:hypothetical protein
VKNIYLIMNEATVSENYHGGIVVEVVSAWGSEQSALEGLHLIALESGIELDPGEDSVYLPVTPTSHLESDEYYIVEMELNN